jgi:hypothetical protein
LGACCGTARQAACVPISGSPPEVSNESDSLPVPLRNALHLKQRAGVRAVDTKSSPIKLPLTLAAIPLVGCNTRYDMKHFMAKAALPLVVVAIGAAGCATMGSGTGATLSGADAVTFNWKGNTASNSGTMTAMLSHGTTFTGQYFQITRDTTVDSLGPLWVGWGGRFGGFGFDYWGDDDSFITKYTGRVVANLAAPDGSHMRCNFQLADPLGGMSGGGSGQCQLPDGKTIDATFPKA